MILSNKPIIAAMLYGGTCVIAIAASVMTSSELGPLLFLAPASMLWQVVEVLGAGASENPVVFVFLACVYLCGLVIIVGLWPAYGFLVAKCAIPTYRWVLRLLLALHVVAFILVSMSKGALVRASPFIVVDAAIVGMFSIAFSSLMWCALSFSRRRID